MNKFELFDLDPKIIESLNRLNYLEPKEVQQAVIPLLLDSKDVLVKSQTGSGKTASFGIPICNNVDWEKRYPQTLVITPTRELALQIAEELFNIGRYRRLKITTLFGKTSFQKQEKQLKQRTHIVVATPGRLLDHINQGTIVLDDIQTVIIDEADELLNMGFINDLDEILCRIPKKRTTALFSATLSSDVKSLSSRYMNHPTEIEIEQTEATRPKIEQSYIKSEGELSEKLKQLSDLMIVENPKSSIVFCNTRDMVERVTKELKWLGMNCDMLHGNMEQRDRSKVIKNYKRGYFHCLIATDVAARGIDVSDIQLVVNYDIPDTVETYTHRIGRTARHNQDGRAISLVNPKDQRNFQEIQTFYGDDLSEYVKPTIEDEEAHKKEFFDYQLKKQILREDKGMVFNQDIMKLHINAGRKTKMRAGDIVGAICQIEGVEASDIGIIDILDISTFIEILNGKGEYVLNALQTHPIKGRLRTVSRSNISKYEQDLANQ